VRCSACGDVSVSGPPSSAGSTSATAGTTRLRCGDAEANTPW
jgi:hypothetical protein